MGGPGGILTQKGVSADQPALVLVDTVNRYHTPGSGKNRASVSFKSSEREK